MFLFYFTARKLKQRMYDFCVLSHGSFKGTEPFHVCPTERDGIWGTGLQPLQREDRQMKGRGRGVSLVAASGRMHAPVPSIGPSTATGGYSFLFCCRCPCVKTVQQLPESKTHASHTILQFHRSASLPKDLYLDSCWPKCVLHISSMFQGLYQLESRKIRVLVLIVHGCLSIWVQLYHVSGKQNSQLHEMEIGFIFFYSQQTVAQSLVFAQCPFHVILT